MKIERVDGYFKHGCSFSGKLVVVDYQEEWKRHPRYEQFGSMAIFDALDEAKKALNERYPNADILLSVPDLVARIE